MSMNKGGIILGLSLIMILAGSFFWLQKKGMDSTTATGSYVYFKNEKGETLKVPLPEGSATGSLIIDRTGPENNPVYGVSFGNSGEIILHEDQVEVAKSFREIVPPRDWTFNPTGHKATQRMYNVFQSIEDGESGFEKMKQNAQNDTLSVYNLELYKFFRSPEDSPLRDCLQKPYDAVNIDTIVDETSKKLCKEKVPQDHTFDIHDQDERYKRFRYHLFYQASITKDAQVCEPLLTTKFPLDKREDVNATHLLNYLLCQSIAEGDTYTNDNISRSEAIRRSGYRINAAIVFNKCSFYTDLRLQTLCQEIYKEVEVLKSKQGNEPAKNSDQ